MLTLLTPENANTFENAVFVPVKESLCNEILRVKKGQWIHSWHNAVDGAAYKVKDIKQFINRQYFAGNIFKMKTD